MTKKNPNIWAYVCERELNEDVSFEDNRQQSAYRLSHSHTLDSVIFSMSASQPLFYSVRGLIQT